MTILILQRDMGFYVMFKSTLSIELQELLFILFKACPTRTQYKYEYKYDLPRRFLFS